jgi:hypothetical protein
VGSASSAYGVGSITSGALDTTWSTGDLLGMAFDTANGTMQFFKNGVSVFSATWTATSGIYYTPFVQLQSASDFVTANFGQRAWQYNPPQGFSALTLKNFARPTGAAATPNQFFDAVTYTGNGVNSPNSLTISSFASFGFKTLGNFFLGITGPIGSLYFFNLNSR